MQECIGNYLYMGIKVRKNESSEARLECRHVKDLWCNR